MVGLLFVIFGVWIYNDIIIMPFIRHNNNNGFIRHAMRTPERKISQQEPIIGAEENAGNQRKISIRSLLEALRGSEERAASQAGNQNQRKISMRSLLEAIRGSEDTVGNKRIRGESNQSENNFNLNNDDRKRYI